MCVEIPIRTRQHNDKKKRIIAVWGKVKKRRKKKRDQTETNHERTRTKGSHTHTHTMRANGTETHRAGQRGTAYGSPRGLAIGGDHVRERECERVREAGWFGICFFFFCPTAFRSFGALGPRAAGCAASVDVTVAQLAPNSHFFLLSCRLPPPCPLPSTPNSYVCFSFVEF